MTLRLKPEAREASKFDVGRGLLKVTILGLLKSKGRCAYQIGKDLRAADETLSIKFGQLYPLLERMESEGFIRGQWEEGCGPKGIYVYGITKEGRKALEQSRKTFLRLMGRVRAIVAGRA